MLAFVGWLLQAKRVVWSSISTLIMLFLAVILISSALAYWPEISRYHFMDFFNWVVIYVVLTQVVTTRRQFILLLLIFMVASFKLSFFGARTWATSGFGFSSWGLWGPEGFFNNPGELAIQMVVFAPIALFFVIGLAPYLPRWQVRLLYLLPVTAAMTTLATNTRGGQLALALQILVFLIWSRKFKSMALVAIVAVIGFQLLPDEQIARFETSGRDETSVQRLLYWEHGWTMMKDHPFLGVGYFNFPAYYDRHHSEDFVVPGLVQAQLPHNIFIQVGTDAGFIGLGIFVLLLAVSVRMMRRIGKAAAKRGDHFVANLTIGMNISLLGFVVGGQFVTVTYYPFVWIHLAFVTMLWTFTRSEQRRVHQSSNTGTIRRAKV